MFPRANLDNNGAKSIFPILFPEFAKVPLTYMLNVVDVLDIAIWVQSSSVVVGTEVTNE